MVMRNARKYAERNSLIPKSETRKGIPSLPIILALMSF